MMSQVVLFAYRIMLNISRRESQKFYERGYIVILSYLCNAIKRSTKFRCIGTLNMVELLNMLSMELTMFLN